MKNFVLIKNAVEDSDYAVVAFDKTTVKAFAVSESSSEWVDWVNSGTMSITDVRESLDYTLQAGFPRHITSETVDSVKSLIGSEKTEELIGASLEHDMQLVDAVSGHGRRYEVKSLGDIAFKDVSTRQLRTIAPQNRQRAIEYKALAFRTDNKFTQTAMEFKKVRALWDPDLGPSGGWRCPSGSQYGGYITDRFGRGCGGGIIRRVGRALVNAGRGIDRVGERMDMRRLNRAANRAQKPGIGERLGDANRRVARGAAMALERGAQRLVGDYQPGDGRLESGRRARRGANAPNLPAGRRREIDDRLQAISAELDDLVDENPTPEIEKRIGELVRENRALRKERDGGVIPGRGGKPNEIAPGARPRGVRPEVGRPRGGEQRNPRRQGARPVRKPIAERQRDGVMERAARRLVGDYQPDEYKPGDKNRIKNRKNRYADVSDKQLMQALRLNGRDRNRPGESRAVEARRRQERLEVLQEMVNRGLPIPDEYKREVKVYKIKPQRKKRGEGLNRRGRAAVALERAAQRVLGAEEQNKPNAPQARKPVRKIDPLDVQKQKIAIARKKRPNGVSDEDWQAYEEYLDNIPDGNLIPKGGVPQLEPVLSYESWSKRIKPNVESRKPKSIQQGKNVADYSDAELLAMMKKIRGDGNNFEFDVAKLSNEDIVRLEKLLEDNNNIFPDRADGNPHPAWDLIGGEFNRRQDNGLLNSIKKPSARSRARSARVSQAASTPIRRPQPKRQRGARLDANNLDIEQNRRLKEAAMAEKAALDANWRKRLGLGTGEPITSRAIKDYIKERENKKPGAYIGVLKANANDWDVLNEFEEAIKGRPGNAGLRPDHVDLLNKVGPKRRQVFADRVNAGSTPGRIRSNRPTPRPKTDIPSNRPTRTGREAQDVQDAINEITGSMPDDRSRRNVRNRFPRNGLPERAFWRDTNWQGRKPGDREKHESRFARYYDADGKINARGRLINEQLQAERDGRSMPQAPAQPKVPTPKPASARPNPPAPKAPTPKAPTPTPQGGNAGVGQYVDKPKHGNALDVIVVGEPRPRVKQVPQLADDGTPDNPMPKAKLIKNSKIQNGADAVKWLNDGNSIEEIPQQFWGQALIGHTSAANKGKKQYKQLKKNGGIIGDTYIFVAIDKKGKSTGQGYVIKNDRHDAGNNINAVLNFQVANAVGIPVDAAGFDGQVDMNPIPAAIIPFAWNRAPVGDIITPKEAGLMGRFGVPNFAAQQFDGLADKAHPQRLAGFMLNYLLQVPDRHNQNHMGAMVDGKPVVIPIDLDWGARMAGTPDGIFDYGFGADRSLFKQMKTHLAGLDAVERQRQLDNIMNTYDGVLTRTSNIIRGGKDKFLQDAVNALPETASNAAKDTAKRRAEQVYKQLDLSLKKLTSQRQEFLDTITGVAAEPIRWARR